MAKPLWDMTVEQLQREIAYYRWEQGRRACPDRQRRAVIAIERREAELVKRGVALATQQEASR